MRYLSGTERRAWVLSTLRTSGFLSVTDLARDLGVSDMTVRRDLRLIEQTGEARTVRGGVSLRHGTLRTSDFLNRAGMQAEAKRRIALEAVRLVRPDDVLAVDSGTSGYEVAAALPDDFAGAVVTASVPVVQLMLNRPRTRLVGLGGELVVPSQAFAGPMTVEAARGVRVRLLFLGAFAVDDRGVYVSADLERPVKQALMDAADEVVLLADAKKFARTAPVLLCPLRRVHRLITDEAPLPRLAKALEQARVQTTLAAVPAGPQASR